MEYESTNHKIRKNWEGSQDNESAIKDHQASEILKDGQVVRLKSTNSIFKRVSDLSTDWVSMAPAWVEVSDHSVSQRVINWVITANLLEDAISLARFDVEYRILGSDNPLLGVLNTYQTFISVEDVPGSITSLKKVTWYIGWNIQKLSLDTIDFEARLLFTIPNPNLYI